MDSKETARLAKLRAEGPNKLQQCLQTQIRDLPILDQVASLADTGQLLVFYESVGQARLEGHSWKAISNAATGKHAYEDGQDLHRKYKSFCKNNGIKPVKMRGISKGGK